MNIKKNILKTFLCLAFVSKSLFAYELSGTRWPVTDITMVVDVQGAEGLWNRTFEAAMFRWSEVTDFSFFIDREFSDPCDENDGRNGVGFTATDCGDEFGSALAVTTSLSDPITGTKFQADITFNINKSWNVYDGPLVPAAGGERLQDFRRVALHELGHVLGLGHTPQGSNSIMGPNIGSVDSLRQDDVNGAKGVTNVLFMSKCIDKFRQYVGEKSGKGYMGGNFTVQETTGGSALNVKALALPHDSEPNSTLWYFTNEWRRISFDELGFCNVILVT
ncbi:MAG: matrixin family metalloprotease [Methylococcaceae bacterium]|nr:matrixin family metalloprotease [Methylococcaceae bacterium]